MSSGSGKCCYSDWPPLRPLSNDSWSRSWVGYTGRHYSSIWMTSLSTLQTSILMLAVCRRSLTASRQQDWSWSPPSMHSYSRSFSTWDTWSAGRALPWIRSEVDCSSRPPQVASIPGLGRVLQAVHTRIRRGGTVFELNRRSSRRLTTSRTSW